MLDTPLAVCLIFYAIIIQADSEDNTVINSLTLKCNCSTMHGRIKGTARSINSIFRTTVLYFLVVRKYSTLFKYKTGKTK